MARAGRQHIYAVFVQSFGTRGVAEAQMKRTCAAIKAIRAANASAHNFTRLIDARSGPMARAGAPRPVAVRMWAG